MTILSARRPRVSRKRPAENQLSLEFGIDGPDDSDEPERWLAVPDWPGYQVSSWGRVHSYRINTTNSKDPDKPRFASEPKLIGSTLPSGHRAVSLRRPGNDNTRTVGVHVLVLELFRGPCPQGMESCHRDGKPANNRVENLYWGTRKSNMVDKLRHGTSNTAKLSEADIPVIWARLVAGEGASAIAREYNVTSGSITHIKSGHTWSHITKELPGWPLVPPDRNERQPVRIPDEFTCAEEIWRPLPGWPAYRLSNHGRVQSLWKRGCQGPGLKLADEWHDLLTSIGKGCRPQFEGSNGDGKPKTLYVHKCVLLAFAGPCPPGLIACHDDGDRLNNHASNLRWDTYSANARDRVEHTKQYS